MPTEYYGRENARKNTLWDSTSNLVAATATKTRQGQSLNTGIAKAVPSSVNKHATKMIQNSEKSAIFLLRLCGTVATNIRL